MSPRKKPAPKRRKGSVTETETGRWLARFREPADPVTGKRRSIAKVFDTEAEADAWVAARRLDAEQGLDVVGTREKQTLWGWLTEFYTKHKVGGKGRQLQKLSARTLETDWDLLTIYVLRRAPALAATPLHKLSTADIALFFTTLGESGLAAATVDRVFRVLSARLTYAVRLRKIPANPMRSEFGAAIVVHGREKRRHKTLSFEQASALLAVCPTTRYGPYFATLLLTGLRPGEGLALTWDSVDFEAAALRIGRSLVRTKPSERERGKGTNWKLDPTKTKKSRSVRMSPELSELLRGERVRYVRERMAAGPLYEDHGLVFATERGKPLHLDTLATRVWKPLLERAALHLAGVTLDPLPPYSRGTSTEAKRAATAAYKAGLERQRQQIDAAIAATDFPMLAPYHLRHTQATLLLRRGVHPKIVADRLGHSTTAVTLEIYSHVTPDMQEEAVSVIADGLLRARQKG